MRYISTIKSYYPSLSKTEKKVADYFIEQKGEIIYQTLLEISRKIKVGEASIVRFVKKIGFGGFQELKLEIAKEYTEEADKQYENYIDLVESNMLSVIKNTKLVLEQDKLNKAIEIIEKSKGLYFYGVGTSGLTAQEAQNRFMRMGKIGNCVIDNHSQMMNSSILCEEDVVIAFSLSGDTKDIVESIKLAKKSKAKIIAVTSYIVSSLSQVADCVILTACKENPLDGGSLGGRISQLYIVDLLCTGYLLRNDSAKDIKEKTAQSILGL